MWTRRSLETTCSGILSGAVGTFVGHPLDSLKTHVQITGKSYSSIFRTIGFIKLFSGAWSPILGQSLINGWIFGVCDASALKLARMLNHDQLTLTDHLFGGCVAGLANSMIICPTELLKTKLQQGQFKTYYDAIHNYTSQAGWTSLMTGLSATLAREVPGYGVYFLAFEAFKSLFGGNNPSFWNIFHAGGFAGCISWASVYPVDVIKYSVHFLCNFPTYYC